MSKDPSTISITYDGTDITRYVLFSSAKFDCQANAMPGTFEFVVKDVDRSLSFVTGKEIVFWLDSVKLYAGILMQVFRQYALPVSDTSVLSNVATRQFRLVGVDFNIYLDKRVIRDTNNYKRGIRIEGRHYDGALIRDYLPTYLDVPSGLDMSTHVDDIELFGVKRNPDGDIIKTTGVRLVQQGDVWRKQMEIFAARSAAVWYINADKELVFKALEDTMWPFTFVDWRPVGAANRHHTIGIRGVTASQDGAPIVNDALVWGGLEQLASKDENDPSGTFFARHKNQDSIDTHGRWQYAEANFQRGDDQISVNHRAEYIVEGPPGTAGGQQAGLKYPIWEVTFSWWAHDVPGVTHIKPGQVANILLYVMGSDRAHPLHLFLPLRSVSASFPMIPDVNGGSPKTWCLFQGRFGISYSDSRHLWKFLLQNKQRGLSSAYAAQAAGNDTSTTELGGFGQYSPVETPNGVLTTFTIPHPYIRGTTKVYINGLLQRLNREYTESDATAGEITFGTAPYADDIIWIETRTGES